MTTPTLTAPPDATPLATIFGRLFENEFATLDGIAISGRLAAGLEYLDESVALARWLGSDDASEAFTPADPVIYGLHVALYAAVPDASSVVSGWSRHLRAIQSEGLALPPATSMMRKRGVTDLGKHLIEPDELVGSALEAALVRARDVAKRDGMEHILLVTTDGMVVVAAPSRIEAMAHWHNIEFAARVECMRVEEADAHIAAG